MKYEIPCSLISELLPLYAEELLQEENRKAVHRHLENCPACRAKLQEMQAKPLTAEIMEDRLEQAKPLKKLHGHFWLNLLTAPIWLPIALLLIVLLGTVLLLILTAVFVFWCIPLSLAACAAGGLVLLLQSLLLSLPINALFATGMLLAGVGGTVLSTILCIQLDKCLLRSIFNLVFRRSAHKKKSLGKEI